MARQRRRGSFCVIIVAKVVKQCTWWFVGDVGDVHEFGNFGDVGGVGDVGDIGELDEDEVLANEDLYDGAASTVLIIRNTIDFTKALH